MNAKDITLEKKFDVIGAFDALEHIAEDEIVFYQMHRAVRFGGGIILSTPQRPSYGARRRNTPATYAATGQET